MWVEDVNPTIQISNRTQKKGNDKTFFKLYPSSLIPIRLYGVTKAYNSKKVYRERTTASPIVTVPYETLNTCQMSHKQA